MTADAAPAAEARRALTVGLVLTVSIAAFEALAVATILPETVRDIGGLEWYGWAFTGFLLANLAGTPLAGEAADRRGPAPPFVAGILLFAVGLVIAGSAHSMPILVAGRVLQGGGGAALSAVSYVAVARAYPADAQPRMMAMLSSAWVIPGLFGPVLAAAVARSAGWRFVFLGLVPPTLVAGVVALSGLRGLDAPAATPATRSTRSRDAMLLAVGVALSLLGARATSLAGALRLDPSSLPRPLASLALAAAGAVLAARSLLRLLPPGTLRARRGLPAAIAVQALLNFAFFAVEAFLPLALMELRGAGTTLVAASLTAGTLAWTTGSWIQAHAAARVPRRRLLRSGLALLLAGAAAATAVLWHAVSPALAVPAWAVAGLGIGIAYPTATLAIFEGAADGREGEASATMQVANALAIAIGTGLGADLLARVAATGRSLALGIGAVDAVSLLACALALAAARGVEPSRGPAHRASSP